MFCKICGSKEVTALFDAANTHGRHILDAASRFNIFCCQDCGVVFVGNIIVNDEYFSKYYPRDYYGSGINGNFLNYILGLYAKAVIGFKQSEILKNLKPGNAAKLRILDVGCGSGDFLANINSGIFEKYGVEVSPDGYKKCSQRNLKVFNKELKENSFEAEYFDVITMWHVLEHLDKPGELLIEARRILKNGGLLIVATPNTDSWGFKLGLKDWFHLDAPRHLILYNQRSLETLLEKTGFKVRNLKKISYDFPLDLFWSVKEYKFRFFIYFLYPLLKILSGETFLAVGEK